MEEEDHSSGGGGMYHVPQQSRREKLRYSHDSSSIMEPQPSSSPLLISTLNPSNYPICTSTPQIPCSLSLSSSSSMAHHALHPPPRHQPGHAELAGPLGPFTGYAEILRRSRFLEPAKAMLDQICDVDGAVRVGDRGPLFDGSEIDEMMTRGGTGGRMAAATAAMEHQQQWKNWLISMLDEVYRRYKLYYQQVQAVITSFGSVPGLGSASPYASMALEVMSKHFKRLKNAMSDQLLHIKEGFSAQEENSGFGIINRPSNFNYDAMRQPHVWRPQRGLPERAVAVLRAWLFEHFLHPYPTDTDKQMLAKQTGLARNQVSNWFINARVRLWKPMVEEVHSLEMRQQNKPDDGITNPNMDKQSRLPSSSTATSSTNQNQSAKRPRDELTRIPNQIQEPSYDLVFDSYSGHRDIGAKGNGGVSLSLGLHQNNGICLTEPIIPLNVHQFGLGLGLDECSVDPYNVIGSLGGQDRHFLHDFVG